LNKQQQAKNLITARQRSWWWCEDKDCGGGAMTVIGMWFCDDEN